MSIQKNTRQFYIKDNFMNIIKQMYQYTTDTRIRNIQTCQTIEDFIQLVVVNNGKTFYEYYISTQPIKPFFDIDFKHNQLSIVEEYKQFCESEEGKEDIIENIELMLQMPIPRTDIIFLYSDKIVETKENEFKFGLHILIDNHQTTSFGLNKLFKQYKQKVETPIFDSMPYKCTINPAAKGIFRLPLCKKNNHQDNMYIPVDNLQPKHFITYVEDNFTNVSLPLEEKEMQQKENKYYKVIDCQIPVEKIKMYLDIYDPPKDYPTWRNCIWSLQSIGITFNSLVEWSKKDLPNFNFDLLKKLYDSFQPNHFTIGTFLYLVVKKNDENEFNDIMEEYCNTEYKQKKITLKMI